MDDLLFAQGIHDIIHEAFKSTLVFQFAVEGIGGIVRTLGNNEDGVSSARGKLFYQFVMLENPFHVVVPAVEMDDEIYFLSCVKTFWNKQGNRAVAVMFICRIKNIIACAT